MRHLLKTLCLAVIIGGGVATAQATDEQGRKCLVNVPAQWTWAAFAMTSKNESSGPADFAAIAGDSDLQGMSVGFLQWNFGSGTMEEFLKHVPDRSSVVSATMPKYGERWISEALASSKGTTAKVAALKYIRSIQLSNERDALYAEIKAFLNHPAVREAQNKAANARANTAWTFAKRLAKDVKLTCRPHFAQFAVLFDYNIQAGEAYIDDLTSILVQYRKNKKAKPTDPAPEERQVASHYMAMRQATWVMGYPHYATCAVPSSPRNSHKWDSQANCAVWREALGVTAPKMESWQAELLYVATITASYRKPQYVEDFGNRKGMIAMGLGYSHGNHCDYTALYRDLDQVEVPDAAIGKETPATINARVSASCKLAKPGP